MQAFLGIRVLNRLGARRTMLLCDACRGPLMLVIPLCHWAGALSFGLIAAVAFAVGAFTAPHFAAQRVIVPELVGEDEGVVSQASALFQGANRVTLLLGPPLAGVLIGLISAPAVLVVDAATYAVSVFLLGVFVPATKPLPAVGEEDRGFRAGLRWAGRDPLFRAWRVSLIVGDMAWQAIFISLPVLVVTRYDADPRIVGAMFAAFGVGAVLGNTVAYRLVKRLDGLTLIARVALGQALPLWLLVFEVPAWAAIGVLGASGLANGLINPSLHAIITLRIPPELRATVISSFMTRVRARDADRDPRGRPAPGPARRDAGVRDLRRDPDDRDGARRSGGAQGAHGRVGKTDGWRGPCGGGVASTQFVRIVLSADRLRHEDVGVPTAARGRARAAEEPRPHAPPSCRRRPP